MNTVCSYIVLVVMSGKDATPSQPVTLADGETASNINFTVKGDTVTPNSITGIAETVFSDLKVYPNPFTDAVRITGVAETGRAASLRVVNAAGVIVHNQKIASSDEVIRLEHLPAGVYLITIDDGKHQNTMRIIKN